MGFIPVVSKVSEANIWLNSFGHLIDVGRTITLTAKGCMISTQQEEL